MKRKTEWTICSEKVDSFLKNKINTSESITNKLSLLRNISPMTETFDNMFDPFLMNDMSKTVDKIIFSINQNKKILIYGDYDCDGILSTVSLYKFLRTLTPHCDWFIPNRFKDGYGLNMNKCFDILEKNYDLVITVDCGIACVDEIDFLTNAGIDVIVTDHHTCPDILPSAFAIIDCKRNDNTYPFKDLCGAGVALKLIQALSEKLSLGNVWKEYVEYTCIATIADIVPLTSENRIIVSEGIKAIKNSNKASIRTLLSFVSKPVSNINSIDIAFSICPKINAASRLKDAKYAMALFLIENEKKCKTISDILLKLNDYRKEIEKDIFKKCLFQIIEKYDFNSLAPIVVYGEDWHPGVIGIVAAKIAELFNRPTIVLSKQKDSDIYTGSCRTFGKINIFDLLSKVSKYFTKFGGHAGAAGLSIKKENISLFINDLKKVSRETLSKSDFVNTKQADLEVKLSDFSLKEVNNIYTLGPFGEGNPEPMFVAKNLTINKIERLGSSGKHIKITVTDNMKTFSLVCFNMGEYEKFLTLGNSIDILFQVGINTWRNKSSIQFLIEDIHSSAFFLQSEKLKQKNSLYINNSITIKNIISNGTSCKDLIPTAVELSQIYSTINDYFKIYNSNDIILCEISSFVKYINGVLNSSFNIFKVARILELLNDTNYINARFINDDIICIVLNNTTDKIPVVKTRAFAKLSQ